MTTHSKQAIIQLASVFAFLAAIIFAYAAYVEHSAGQSAMRFCASVHVGSGVERIMSSAVALGADGKYSHWRTTPYHDWLQLVFTGFTPLSRHVCSVEVASSRVVSVRYSYLD